MRLIGIGDIHGHLDKLNQLLERINPRVTDQIVFLGDYIDRGPESCGVIERLILLQSEFPNTIFLRGNHEQMLLDALIEDGVITGKRLRDISECFRALADSSDRRIFLCNGGMATLKSYGLHLQELENFPRPHLDFILLTQLSWRFHPYVFVHAGMVDDGAEDLYNLLWDRDNEPGKNGIIHVVGHTPTEDTKPIFENGRYSLDTGAAYGNPLTACNVFTREVWQSD